MFVIPFLRINLFLLQHGKIEFTGQSAAPTLQMGAVFSPVHTQSSIASPISIPTHYQQNNKARNSAFRYGRQSFTSHHLQPILPRPTSQNSFIQPQEVTSKPVEKAFEPKVQNYQMPNAVMLFKCDVLTHPLILLSKVNESN